VKNWMVTVALLMVPGIAMGQEQTDLSGTFAPAGPPVDAPVRVDAGPTCIVDLIQRYEVGGDLAGRMEIDFRILVHGPCGSPPGAYDEEWIARGTLDGSLNREPASGTFVYTADVRGGGEVNGRMVFGGGLEGELTIVGKFSDGELRYTGALEGSEGAPDRSHSSRMPPPPFTSLAPESAAWRPRRNPRTVAEIQMAAR
jgi:hypothetical protein